MTYLVKFGVFLFQLHQIFNPLFVVFVSHKFSIFFGELNVLLTENLVFLQKKKIQHLIKM